MLAGVIQTGMARISTMQQRIGFGYDVHALAEGRDLILGGVTIDHPCGLLGHSDADVLSHAIADALLGSLALGDLGEHFPPHDAQWCDASSIELLAKVAAMVADAGWAIGNIDATVVAEVPQLAPYRDTMRRNLADACAVAVMQVSVKATTTEQLGFCGREEGIAAKAVVLIRREQE